MSPVRSEIRREQVKYAHFRRRYKYVFSSPTVETAAQADSATGATDAGTWRCPVSQRHLGELARCLREAAGLTRKQLAAEVGLSDMSILNFELARRLPTKDTLDRLLAHPALARLVDLALAEGVAVELRPELPVGVDVVAVLIRRRP